MTDHQSHDDPVRDHAAFSDRVGLFSKPGMGTVRCMQDSNKHRHQEDNTGPYADRPVNMWFSPDFACQVIVRIHAKHDLDSQEHVDARAHVIHCAGYLLCYLLTSLPYFTLVDVSDDDAAAIWAAVAEKHLSWAEACKAEGAKADSHPMLAALKAVSADCAEYESMCSLIRHMLHPDVRQRANVEQVLEAGFFTNT